MDPHLVDEASQILRILGRDWRDLVVGSEGFLTAKGRYGLLRHTVEWGKMDVMGHVNNVQYVRYAESGRVQWTRNIGTFFDPIHQRQWEELVSSKGIGLILKSITVDFKFPMTCPDRVSVFHKLRSRPTEQTKSLVLDVMILSEAKQRPAARCLEDVVIYDYKMAKKSRLAPYMLEQFRQIYDLQEQAKETTTNKIQKLLDRVTWLEKQSWDRPNAQESFGPKP